MSGGGEVSHRSRHIDPKSTVVTTALVRRNRTRQRSSVRFIATRRDATSIISRDAAAADRSLLRRRCPWRRRQLATAAVRRRHRRVCSGRDRQLVSESGGRRAATTTSRTDTSRTSHAGPTTTRGSDWRQRRRLEIPTTPSVVAFCHHSHNNIYNNVNTVARTQALTGRQSNN